MKERFFPAGDKWREMVWARADQTIGWALKGLSEGREPGMSIVEPQARTRPGSGCGKALQRAPLFADLEAHSMVAVERELTLLVLPGGAPLFRQGEPADAVYVVASGCLGVFRHDEDEGSAEGEPAPDGRDPARQHRGRDVAAVAQPAHAQRRGAARQRGLAPGPQDSFDKLTARHPEVLPTLMRSVAARNAMGPTKRRRQPRTFAILPAGARRRRRASRCCWRRPSAASAARCRCSGPNSMDARPGMVRALRDR